MISCYGSLASARIFVLLLGAVILFGQDRGDWAVTAALPPGVSSAQTSSGSILSIWPNSAVPYQSFDMYLPIEVGEKFQVSETGQVLGVRFYKDSLNTGTHIGHLWSENGELLGTVKFASESAYGWQSARFANSVSIQAHTTYVVSYYSSMGAYSADVFYLGNPYQSGPITLLSSRQAGGNGVSVFTNGEQGKFPDEAIEATNYWADILFRPGPPPPPVIPFKHVVIVVQENRTPDNLFQGLCAPPYGTAESCSMTPRRGQYDIQTNDWVNKDSPRGTIQPAQVPLANHYDLDHSHSAFAAMCDADPLSGVCKMDGASRIRCTGTCLTNPHFRYVDNSGGELNPYLDLATQYGWANYMFQTNQGPSFPAHQFIFGGTSAPTAADDAAGIFASENMSHTGSSGGSSTAGCIAPANTTVQLVGPAGIEQPNERIYPCFEHETVADVLPKSVTWRYYTPSAGSIWTAPNAIQHICESSGPDGKCEGSAWSNNVDLAPADILKDIRNCNLRSLSWAIPTGANSDHANTNDGGGPSWVAAIVNEIGNNSKCDDGRGYWNDTAILITWDDWGGWYDHEPPTVLPAPEGGYQYGFRVPLIVVSAYTPEGEINSARHDFGSILRFVEKNFGVKEGALKFADARAENDLFAFFDFGSPPKPYKTIKAPLSAPFFLNDPRPATDPDDD